MSCTNPPNAAGHSRLWSHLASVINSSVACLAGKDEWTHAWGGSMALRVEIARRGDLRGLWRGLRFLVLDGLLAVWLHPVTRAILD